MFWNNLLAWEWNQKVSGTIKSPDGAPIAHLIVQAFDVELNSSIKLGQTLSDPRGYYVLDYSPDLISKTGRKYANLQIKVLSFTGEPLFTSEIHFNAGRRETVNLTVDAPPKLSEFEQLTGILQLLIDEKPIAALTEADIPFILNAHQTHPPAVPFLDVVSEERLLLFIQSNELAQNLPLPQIFFYGIARVLSIEPPLSLENFLSQSDADAEANLKTAVKRKFIPTLNFAEIRPQWERLKIEQKIVIGRNLILKLASELSGLPVVSHNVRATHITTHTALGDALSDQNGIVVFNYFTDGSSTDTFDVEVLDLADTSIIRTTVEAGDENAVITILVDIPTPADRSPEIIELGITLGLEIPDGLSDALERVDVRTLTDLRALGGFDQIDDLPASPDHPTLIRLEAHANLLTLSSYEPEEMNTVIEAGFDSISKLGSADRVSFVNRLQEDLGHYKAASILTQAQAVDATLQNMITSIRMDRFDGPVKDAPGDTMQTLKAQLNPLLPDGCSCNRCQTTVSPAAYLADLITYCKTYLKADGDPVTLETLGNTFHQPLGELTTACEEVEKKVRQIRICIEVLRRYLIANNLPAAGSEAEVRLERAYRHYLETVYASILNLLGSSLQELRETLLFATDEEKDKLAIKLRLPDRERLADLVIDFDTLNNPQIEQELEHLFGLVDTNRDPLSDPLKLDDVDNQLRGWNLDGVAWNQNTDADGYIYLSLTHPDTTSFRIEAFKDSDRTQLVAAGETDTADGLVSLLPAEAATGDSARSGLRGQISLQFSGEDQNIRFSAVPLMLSLQFKFLYAQWEARAQAVDPIIDPDLVTIAHLVEPLEENQAFFLWKQRHNEITARLEFLRNLDANAGDAARLQSLLSETGITLDGGELLPEELEYLQNIQAVLSQPEPVPLLDIEWENIISILVQVEKRRRRETWLDEETAQGIALVPDYFKLPEIFAAGSRDLPPWRANPADLRDFEHTLKSLSEEKQTLVDDFRKVIDVVTDDNLALLRDALIMATDAGGSTLTEKAEWITENLLINAQMDACLQTTRVAQAIETLQSLLLTVRTGQLDAEEPEFSLHSDDFDEEWKWIGAYETWRAAMMVFLYPENVLDPALRHKQTSGFKRLVDALRDNTRLTSLEACQEAQKYADFLADISNLSIEATAEARSAPAAEDCPEEIVTSSLYRTFLFARAEDTGRVYLSVFDPGVSNGYNQSFWEPVSGLGSVEEVLGAAVYEISDNRRFIYLFVKKIETKEEKLFYIRYDLEARQFEKEGASQLELPVETKIFRAAINQRNNSHLPPELSIQVDKHVFINRMNIAGNTLDPLVQSALGGFLFQVSAGRPLQILAMLSFDAFPEREYVLPQFFVLIGKNDNQIYYKLFQPVSPQFVNLNSTYTTTPVTLLANGDWTASIIWPSDPNIIYTFWRQNGQLKYNAIFYDKQIFRAAEEPDDPNQSLGNLPGLNQLMGVARNTGAQSSPSFHKQIAFQLSGARRGPFLGFFTRNMSATGLLLASANLPASTETTSRALVTGLANQNPNGRGSDILFRINIGRGTIFDNDGGIYDPGDGFPPPPPPPPIDPTVPENLPISEIQRIRLAPLLREPVEIVQKLTEAELQIRKAKVAAIFADNNDSPRTNLTYLEEAFFFVPALLAINLKRRGHFIDALDWIRTVYDYTQEGEHRKIYHGLVTEESLPWDYQRNAEWLLEPLNPHAIAATRQNGYTRFVLRTLVQCFIEFANAEFSRDTSESVTRAHTLYMTALEFLALPELNQVSGTCEKAISDIGREVLDVIGTGPARVTDAANTIIDGLREISDSEVVTTTVAALREQLSEETPLLDRLQAASTIVNAARYSRRPDSFAAAESAAGDTRRRVNKKLLSHSIAANAAEEIAFAVETDYDHTFTTLLGHSRNRLQEINLPWLGGRVTTPRIDNPIVAADTVVAGHFEVLNSLSKNATLPLIYDSRKFLLTFFAAPGEYFCVPDNPLIEFLKSEAELSLKKIRNCRNIAGLERVLEPYSVAIDTQRDIPVLDGRAEVIFPEDLQFAPTLYRFRTLIDRAKLLVNIAQQLEATFLSILEKRDSEYYNLLKSRQDASLSLAGVRLRQMGLQEARDRLGLASLQLEKALIQEEHFQALANESDSGLELDKLVGIGVAVAGAVATGGSTAVVAAKIGAGVLGSLLSSDDVQKAQIEFSLKLAKQDVLIGAQQTRLAGDRLRIVGQELAIANQRANHSRETLDFLVNKFTSAELYDWMSGVLEEVYSSFLQQATAVAQLAANQLTFERQEPVPNLIQSDYWEAPLGLQASLGGESAAPDRRGLTGSARLLQDIFQLDQFAFNTRERKHELSKTISLAGMVPAEFQRFRESGVLNFVTPMEIFDRDFPGHYLRLIERIRISVIAITPTLDGIKATVTGSGISKVVTGPERFRESLIIRSPENIAFTSAIDATGQFEFVLLQDNELLRPFEGNGVATQWTLELPKAANQFNFNTITDVLLKIEYTALFSADYRTEVVKRLNRDFNADRGFSFRHEFADQWFDLNNPDQTATPMTVRFTTQRNDFPPNLAALKIEDITLFFDLADGQSFEVDVSHLLFKENGDTAFIGGGGTTLNNVISTRRGNAPDWIPMIGKSPFGEWELALPDIEVLKEQFRNEAIENILFVITYRATTPAWPE